MSTYRRYQDARDAAWRTLLRFSVRALPVDVRGIAAALGLSLHPFPDADQEPQLHALAARALGGAACVSLRLGRAWHAFLAPGVTEESHIRFALAHELGHLILAHETCALSPGVRAFQGRENAGDLIEAPQELDDYAADIFAIRLLAPACVLRDLRADTPSRISALCGLPPRASALRAERMELLLQRDAFFAHPLERQVHDRFRPYLAARAAGRPLDPSPLPQENAPSRAGVDAPLSPSAPDASRKSALVRRIVQSDSPPWAEEAPATGETLSPAGEKTSAFLEAAPAAPETLPEADAPSAAEKPGKVLAVAAALLIGLAAVLWALIGPSGR